jgi:3-oxoadipate enol-lactonase
MSCDVYREGSTGRREQRALDIWRPGTLGRRQTMATLGVNGTTLFWEQVGIGQPVLFIHGMCGDASVWADQMRRLSPHARCLAYDRRGHSRSPLGQIERRTVELHADDAAQLILELGLAPCIVVGSSGGARIALDLIRRYPRLVRGAVLSEPPAMALAADGGKAFVEQIKPAVEMAVARGGPRAAVDAFFEIVCPGLWRALPDEPRDHPYRANAAELLGDLGMPQYQITPADLRQIRVPSLIVRGSESHPMFRAIAGTLAENLPQATLVELRGSGHVTYAEKPAEFAGTVESFASSLIANA